MLINPKKGILLVQKHKSTKFKADIAMMDDDADKRLITGTVHSKNSLVYKEGESVIFGKYSLFQLTIQGTDFYFLDEEDVIGVTDYKENV